MSEEISNLDEENFNYIVKKLKLSTSIEKSFKKVNPLLIHSWTLSLPRRLMPTMFCIFSEITKNIYYQKDTPPDIWSKDTIEPYTVMKMCGKNFSSEDSVRYYRKTIQELVDLNLIYEYRYPFSQKYNIYIRLFSIEHEIYQWKIWDINTPILPSTVKRIIRSYHEVFNKSRSIIKTINKNFNEEKIKIHFVNYLYKNFIQKMSPEISSEISSYKILRKQMSPSEYLKYVIDKVSQFGEFYGLDKNIKDKIFEKSETLMELLINSNHKQDSFEKYVEGKKTPVAENKTPVAENKTPVANKPIDVILLKQDVNNGSENTRCSTQETGAKILISNELDKMRGFSTDILYNNIDLSLYNNKNKEYNNIDMKKKKIIELASKRDGDVSNSRKGSRTNMEKMCIEDIVPENESFRKPKREHKIKVSGDKKYRSHKDGWIFNGLTGGIFGGPRDFMKYFRKTINKYHKNIEFSRIAGSYQREMNCAAYTMDDLIKRDCNNESIVIEWMEWYAQVFLKNKKVNDPKFLLIEFFRKTWEAFDKVRRKDILIVNPEKNSIINENSISFRMNKMFNDGYNEESILKSLRFFGIFIVSNYLQNKFGKEYDAVSKIDSIFEKVKQDKNRESIIVSIFNSTCRFMCDFVDTKNTILKDWTEKYNNFWLLGGCNFDFYKKNNILIGTEKGIAEDFFKEIYGNVGSK